MTLLEMTVVILVLLSLITVLFIGARAWKRGTDRTACVINIRNTQLGVRSYQNMRGLPDGTAINLLTDVMGPRSYLKNPVCPGLGTYDHLAYIPAPGELVMWCSLGAMESHVPKDPAGW